MRKILSLVVLFFYFFCLFFPVTANADSIKYYAYYFAGQHTVEVDIPEGSNYALRIPLVSVPFIDKLRNDNGGYNLQFSIHWASATSPILRGISSPDSISVSIRPDSFWQVVNGSNHPSYKFQISPVQFSMPDASYPHAIKFFSNVFFNVYDYTPAQKGTAAYYLSFTVISTFPLDLSGISSTITSGLLGVSTDLNKINQSLQIFQSAVQSGFSNIDARLLQLIQAVNNSSNSGGGTSAIVSALKDLQNDIVDFRTDNVEGLGNLNTTLSDGVKNLQDKLDLVNESTKDIVAELKRIQQEANERAESGSGQIQGMVQSLEQGTRERWEVIFFPIDFTRQIFSIFTQGTASEYYRTNYKNIVGYKYNDETYCLDPIYDYSKTDFPTTHGTKITFPEFVLDIPHYGRYVIWESFTYDLRELVANFEIMFEAIHLVAGISLFYWTLDYILDFFQEVIED